MNIQKPLLPKFKEQLEAICGQSLTSAASLAAEDFWENWSAIFEGISNDWITIQPDMLFLSRNFPEYGKYYIWKGLAMIAFLVGAILLFIYWQVGVSLLLLGSGINYYSKHKKVSDGRRFVKNLRKAEVANLRWDQVDMRSKEIEVVRTKSGKKRVIPISDDLYEELKSIRERNGNTEFVFQYADQKTGEKRHLKYFRRSFETACRRAKITGFTFHDLRHTFASRLVRSGVDLITVKDLLGHYSVKTTERYTHSNKEQKQKAVELLSNESGGKKAEKVVNLSPICHTEDKGNFDNPLIPLLSKRWAVSSVGRAQRSQR